MKKLDVISFIAIVAAVVGLVLLKVTGMTGHIAISLIALVIMVVCTILGKKDWKVPAIEILYRACYLVALITGFVMVNTGASGGISIAHKVFAGIFAGLYVVNFVIKAVKK